MLLTVWLGGVVIGTEQAHAFPSSLRLPFQSNVAWYVCQGYNGGVSHGGDFALDLTTYSGRGSSGCWGGENAAAGKPVYAPASGSLARVSHSVGGVCITFGGGGSMYFGHLTDRRSDGSVSKGDLIGRVAPAGSAANGGYAHLHLSARSGAGCGGARVPFDDAHGARFDGAPNLYASGVINQWAGTRLIRRTGSNPSVAIDFARSPRPGDVRVRGWARDADKPSAQLKVKIYVGGEYRGTLTAYRKKAGAKYSGHYYDGHVTTAKRGRQSVCVIAVNVGGGSNSKRCWWRADWGTAVGRSAKANGVALSGSCGHVGTIVRRPSDGASFLVKYDCKRYWIPSGWHFERMVSNGVHVNRHLSKSTVNAIPSSGKRAAAKTIDDGATGFQLYGPSRNITHVTSTSYGYSSDYRWTYWAKASKHENAAAWTYSLPRGVYRLKIYIPRRNAGAGVRYEVYDGHKVGNRIKRCDVYKKQANLSGWTNLCEVAIKSGKARIVLRDNRGTGPQYAHLGIDATRIIPMR